MTVLLNVLFLLTLHKQTQFPLEAAEHKKMNDESISSLKQLDLFLILVKISASC